MAYTRAVSSWFVARRGMALAVVMSGGAVGAMILPPIAALLIQRVGWRAACALLGAMVRNVCFFNARDYFGFPLGRAVDGV